MATQKKKPAPKMGRVNLKLKVKGRYASIETFFKYEAERRGIFLENYRNAAQKLLKKYSASKQLQKNNFADYVNYFFDKMSDDAKEAYINEVLYYQFKDSYDTTYIGYRFFLNGKYVSADQFFIIMDNFEADLPENSFLFKIAPEVNHSKRTVKLRILFKEVEEKGRDKYGNHYVISEGQDKK